MLSRLWERDRDDEDVVQAHRLVLSSLSDADKVRVTEAITGKNWRDQLTVGQVQQLERELGLRLMGKERN